jgi:hypothetical protein
LDCRALPNRFLDYINGWHHHRQPGWPVGWARDSRDSILYPTAGRYQTNSSEVGLPGTDMEYYKNNYQHQWFYPIGLIKDVVLALNGEFGYGDGYGGKPFPFYKSYYAGGVNSVRGYDTSTLGPRDEHGDPIGGNRRIVGNAELLFPFPGLSKDKSVRAACSSTPARSGRAPGSSSRSALDGDRATMDLAGRPAEIQFCPAAGHEGRRQDSALPVPGRSRVLVHTTCMLT